jgi:hypothetical protein
MYSPVKAKSDRKGFQNLPGKYKKQRRPVLHASSSEPKKTGGRKGVYSVVKTPW